MDELLGGVETCFEITGEGNKQPTLLESKLIHSSLFLVVCVKS